MSKISPGAAQRQHLNIRELARSLIAHITLDATMKPDDTCRTWVRELKN